MIIFMGVAGAGKSVQGRRLADELAVPWLSTGEFLRMLTAGATRKHMLSGKLMNDEEIISLVRKIFAVVDTENEFILDGFPRTVGQADWLLNQAKYGQLDITAIVNISATREVVKERLLNRGRLDDHEEAIEERFQEYEQTIVPILDQFRMAKVTVLDVDGDQSIEQVHDDIEKALRQVK
jgi:adenylate kinase